MDELERATEAMAICIDSETQTALQATELYSKSKLISDYSVASKHLNLNRVELHCIVCIFCQSLCQNILQSNSSRHKVVLDVTIACSRDRPSSGVQSLGYQVSQNTKL